MSLEQQLAAGCSVTIERVDKVFFFLTPALYTRQVSSKCLIVIRATAAFETPSIFTPIKI